MASRMEKYYNTNNAIKQRSQKNQDLYRDIYDLVEYSNIEGIATMEKSNEIDITKIKKMLKNREEYKKQKEYRKIINKDDEKEIINNSFSHKEEDKNYDIRDILNKAKDKKPEENSYRSLDDTNYNILKNLKLDNLKNYDLDEDNEDDLKELINTITNTSMLNKMNDHELGLNMFDLESNNNTIVAGKKSIKDLLEQAKEIDENNIKHTRELDKSFYSNSLNFSKEDFEDINEKLSNKKTKKIILKITLFSSLLITTGIIIFIVYNLIN